MNTNTFQACPPQIGMLTNTQLTYIANSLPSERFIESMAAFFSIFADPTRLKIVCALGITPMCVGDIASILKLNQSTVSHSLRLLKDAGMVNSTRSGKLVSYVLTNPYIDEVMLTGVEHCLDRFGEAS